MLKKNIIPKFSVNLSLPVDLVNDIDDYISGFNIESRTKFIIQLIRLGFTVTQNKHDIEKPEFIKILIENIESDKIDNFFDSMEAKKLEAIYVFAKSEMEKRYGKSSLDKYV